MDFALRKVAGVDLYVLLDTSAATIVMFYHLANRQHSKLEQNLTFVVVANDTKSGICGNVRDNLAFSGNIEIRLTFAVMKKVPFDLVMVLPMLERLGGTLFF